MLACADYPLRKPAQFIFMFPCAQPGMKVCIFVIFFSYEIIYLRFWNNSNAWRDRERD